MNRVYAPLLSLEGPQRDVRLLRACRQAREIPLFAISRQWMRAIGSKQEKIPYYDRTVILVVYSYVVIFFPQETIAREYLALLCGIHIPKKGLAIRTFLDRMDGIQLFGCFTVLLRRTEALMPLVDCDENNRLISRLNILRYRWKEWLVLNQGITESHPVVVEAICDAERALAYIISDDRSIPRFKAKLSAFIFSFSLGFAPALFIAFKAKDIVSSYEAEHIQGAEGAFEPTFAADTRTSSKEIVDSLYFFIHRSLAASVFSPGKRPLAQRLGLYAPSGVQPISTVIVPVAPPDSESTDLSPSDEADAAEYEPPDIDLGAVWDEYAN